MGTESCDLSVGLYEFVEFELYVGRDHFTTKLNEDPIETRRRTFPGTSVGAVAETVIDASRQDAAAETMTASPDISQSRIR